MSSGQQKQIQRKALETLGSRIIRQADAEKNSAHNPYSRQHYKAKIPFAQHLNVSRFESEMWFEALMHDPSLGQPFQSKPLCGPGGGIRSPYHTPFIFDYWRNLPVGIYYVDFAFPILKIGVEIDGGSHQDPVRKLKDECKDRYLANHGWVVLRVNAGDDMAAQRVRAQLHRVRTLLDRFVQRRKRQLVKLGDTKYQGFLRYPDRDQIVTRLRHEGLYGREDDPARVETNDQEATPKNVKRLVTQSEVDQMVRQTGESSRKCYYWLLSAALRKNPPAPLPPPCPFDSDYVL